MQSISPFGSLEGCAVRERWENVVSLVLSLHQSGEDEDVAGLGGLDGYFDDHIKCPCRELRGGHSLWVRWRLPSSIWSQCGGIQPGLHWHSCLLLHTCEQRVQIRHWSQHMQHWRTPMPLLLWNLLIAASLIYCYWLLARLTEGHTGLLIERFTAKYMWEPVDRP